MIDDLEGDSLLHGFHNIIIRFAFKLIIKSSLVVANPPCGSVTFQSGRRRRRR